MIDTTIDDVASRVVDAMVQINPSIRHYICDEIVVILGRSFIVKRGRSAGIFYYSVTTPQWMFEMRHNIRQSFLLVDFEGDRDQFEKDAALIFLAAPSA